MKFLWMLCLACSFFPILKAQNAETDQASAAGVFFEESFDDNSHKWLLVKNRKQEAHIKDGYYHLQGKSKSSPAFYSMPLPLNEQPEFHLETSLVHKGGAKNMGYGLCWGAREDQADFYAFLLSSNRQYTILRVKRGKYRQIKPWTKSKLVKPSGKENLLAVRKVNDIFEYYLNGRKVYTSKAEPLKGNLTGVLLHGRVKLEVDFLLAKEIPAPIPDTLPVPIATAGEGLPANSEQGNAEKTPEVKEVAQADEATEPDSATPEMTTDAHARVAEPSADPAEKPEQEAEAQSTPEASAEMESDVTEPGDQPRGGTAEVAVPDTEVEDPEQPTEASSSPAEVKDEPASKPAPKKKEKEDKP